MVAESPVNNVQGNLWLNEVQQIRATHQPMRALDSRSGASTTETQDLLAGAMQVRCKLDWFECDRGSDELRAVMSPEPDPADKQCQMALRACIQYRDRVSESKNVQSMRSC